MDTVNQMWPTVQPELSDGVVLLRAFQAEDASAVFRACQDSDIQHFTQVPVPYLGEHADSWVNGNATLWADGHTANFAVVELETGTFLGVVGVIGADQVSRQAGFGYWTAPWGRGRGHTTRAAVLASDWALGAGGLQVLAAEVEAANPASTRVVEAAGFLRVDAPPAEAELKGSMREFVLWERRIGDRPIASEQEEAL